MITARELPLVAAEPVVFDADRGRWIEAGVRSKAKLPGEGGDDGDDPVRDQDDGADGAAAEDRRGA